MAGRAHAAGYRSATTLFETDGPDVRLVAVADANDRVADDAARRYGYERAEYDWRAIAEALRDFAPDEIVYVGDDAVIVDGLIAPVEAAWPAHQTRPRWMAISSLTPTVLRFVGTDAGRRRRFFGISEVTSRARPVC